MHRENPLLSLRVYYESCLGCLADSDLELKHCSLLIREQMGFECAMILLLAELDILTSLCQSHFGWLLIYGLRCRMQHLRSESAF